MQNQNDMSYTQYIKLLQELKGFFKQCINIIEEKEDSKNVNNKKDKEV